MPDTRSLQSAAAVPSAQRLGAVLLASLILLGPSGCLEPPAHHALHPRRPGDERVPMPDQSISAYQLAGQLQLRVLRSSPGVAVLGDDHNRVLLFGEPGGAVYVNGRPLQAPGPVTSASDLLFVQRQLAPRIESMLRRPAGATTPRPVTSRTAAPARPRGPTMVIDPGHGGKDPGARSVLGYYEVDVVLPVSLAVMEQLERQGLGVVATRRSDEFIELDARADLSNRQGPELFVSIHADWAQNPAAEGFTLYVARGASARSWAAARAIERRLQATGTPSRGVREANFRVLVRTQAPAVLIEMGYLSNHREAARLSTPQYQQALADAIAQGIADALR